MDTEETGKKKQQQPYAPENCGYPHHINPDEWQQCTAVDMTIFAEGTDHVGMWEWKVQWWTLGCDDGCSMYSVYGKATVPVQTCKYSTAELLPLTWPYQAMTNIKIVETSASKSIMHFLKDAAWRFHKCSSLAPWPSKHAIGIKLLKEQAFWSLVGLNIPSSFMDQLSCMLQPLWQSAWEVSAHVTWGTRLKKGCR